MEDTTIRLVERIIVSSGGILSIYLGYRLFALTAQSTSSGTFRLKDIVEIGLSKVGPGVFFALFGAWILYSSYANPVTISTAANGSGILSRLVDQKAIEAELKVLKDAIGSLPKEKQLEVESALNLILLNERIRSGGIFVGENRRHDEIKPNGMVDG